MQVKSHEALYVSSTVAGQWKWKWMQAGVSCFAQEVLVGHLEPTWRVDPEVPGRITETKMGTNQGDPGSTRRGHLGRRVKVEVYVNWGVSGLPAPTVP